MKLVRRSLLPALGLVLIASVAPAQQALAQEMLAVPAAPSVSAAPVVPGGPRVESARAGVQSHTGVVATERAAPAPMRRADTKRSRTLMIIGGAALLGGAIVGDDAGQIIMLGGLGVGLYGLYLHLQ
jgi:hypothetical protein